MVTVVASRSGRDLSRIVHAFEAQYGRTLASTIASQTSGLLCTLLCTVVEGTPPYVPQHEGGAPPQPAPAPQLVPPGVGAGGAPLQPLQYKPQLAPPTSAPPLQPQYSQPPPVQPQYSQPPPVQPQYSQQPPPVQPQYSQQPPPVQPQRSVPQPQYAQPPPAQYAALPRRAPLGAVQPHAAPPQPMAPLGPPSGAGVGLPPLGARSPGGAALPPLSMPPLTRAGGGSLEAARRNILEESRKGY